MSYFKIRFWGQINARTVNGAYYNPNSKVYQSYYKKGIKVLLTKDQFYAWCDSNSTEIMRLFSEGKTPSIDRINSYGHYEVSNMQILDNKINAQKGSDAAAKVNRKPVIATHKDGRIFYTDSVVEMARLLDTWPICVSECLTGRARQHRGYTFKYGPK